MPELTIMPDIDGGYRVTIHKVFIGRIDGANTITDYRGNTYQPASLSEAIMWFQCRSWDVARNPVEYPSRTKLLNKNTKRWSTL